MVWHYHDDDVPGPVADVSLELRGLPLQTGKARLQHFRIDEEHSNSFTAWKQMGSPQDPTPEQYRQLEEAGRLARLDSPSDVDIMNGSARIRFALPRQAVSLLVLHCDAP